jgi:signal transduction histidine kinase
MSLKTRLRIWIVALVVGVVAALAALNLTSVATAKFEDLLERATVTAQQVQSVLVERLSDQMAVRPRPQTLEETKALWSEITEHDEALARFLKDTLASSRTIIEIQIVGEDGKVLAAADPASAGKSARRVPSLAQWGKKSPWKRLVEVFSESADYEVAAPLGVAEQQAPVFEVRIVISSVLLRNTLEPLVRRSVIALSVSFLAAILLAVLVSNLAFRPLARVSDAIDRIARGEFPKDPPAGKEESKEVAALESKLQVLGQQFRGAREDAVQLRGNIEQLLERLEEAVLLFDRNDRLIMAGRAAEGMVGKGRWELMGRTLEELFPASTPLGAAVRTAVELRRSLKDYPITIERDGQAPVRLLVNLELIESFPSRERLGAMVTLRDAETRREIGTQLDISTRLAAISRLTGGVAHEIKNPLNSIALHLELLRAKLGDQNPDVDQEIDVISNEITRLDRVVKTFLDFTKPVELTLADVEAVELAREIAMLVGPEASGRNTEIVVDAEPGPVTLRADRDLVKQAVLNVVMNGVEAMQNGGRLRIEVKRAGNECVIGVSDQGAGIPPELRDKIFNLYFTTKGKGSGIGLAVTFRVVQLHNGTVDFASQPGAGTTFWLRFPALGPAPVPEREIA